MSLFEWMKWSRNESHSPIQKLRSEKATEPLMMELALQIKECQRLANMSTDEQKIQETGKICNWVKNSQSLKPCTSPEEQSQLQLLCSKIHPMDTEIVLYKIREVWADAEPVPQQIINIFKQVLQEFIDTAEEDERQRTVIQQWIKKHMLTFRLSSKSSNRISENKEEIPTISSYVDKSLHNVYPTAVQKIWNLPQYYPSANAYNE
ncbi:protein RD3-like [Callorhinchus milii]|uniref:RD3 like n=1 Tax=Callorhinchus milii TaxID=7868 RepID=A0A4W3J0Z4_CALMI|nr:protein RD3-like [Callorhinchus milii]|eukprot:gi/632942512/ref/XP_007886450.1/ PREDICTED: protein RD3-like [Callorhinchus milii]